MPDITPISRFIPDLVDLGNRDTGPVTPSPYYRRGEKRETVFIYCLKSPDGKIKYVGKATHPRKRLYEHLLSAARNHPQRVCRWIASTYIREGIYPEMEILEEVPKDQWEEVETAYIRLFKCLGMALVNVSAGGAGIRNPSGSTHHRSGKKLTLEQKAHLAKTRPKRSLSQEQREAIRQRRLGTKHSPLARENMRIAKLGRKMPVEVVEKSRLTRDATIAARLALGLPAYNRRAA